MCVCCEICSFFLVLNYYPDADGGRSRESCGLSTSGTQMRSDLRIEYFGHTDAVRSLGVAILRINLSGRLAA